MITREDDQEIAVLRLSHGKASALDVELLAELRRQLDSTRTAAAVVLTGTGTIFSAGVDLVRLIDGGAEYAQSLLRELDQVISLTFTFPRPVIAAINGHAIAGGCVLAMLADYRLMAGGNGRIGVPELLVGVPFPPLVLEVLRAALAPPVLQRLVLTGQSLTAEEALRDGLVDEVVAPEELRSRALRLARTLAAIPDRAYELAKRQLRAPALAEAKRAVDAMQAEVIELWSSAETHAAVRSYVERTLRKPSNS